MFQMKIAFCLIFGTHYPKYPLLIVALSCDFFDILHTLLTYHKIPFFSKISSLYVYINGRTDVCLSVCLLVCGGLMEIQIPAPILMKFCTHISTSPSQVLVQVDPRPLTPWAWGPETL